MIDSLVMNSERCTDIVCIHLDMHTQTPDALLFCVSDLMSPENELKQALSSFV